MKLTDFIKETHCSLLQSCTKTESIMELLDMVERIGAVDDMENLRKEIFYREQIMSTGIGRGLAVPHVRFKGVKDPLILIGIKEDGIGDYESIDDEKVKIVIMILVGADQHKEYLRILSLVVHKLKDKNFQERLIACENAMTMANLFAED